MGSMDRIRTRIKPFLEYLHQEKEKISYLQLIGKLEEFLVKEFCYFIFTNSEGMECAVVNMGSKKTKEQEIDICILSGTSLDDPKIIWLIEAKYFRNRHRFKQYNATDEITTTMKSLNKQMHNYNVDTHGWFKVSSKVTKIFGLVFASYVSEEQNTQEKQNYSQRILKAAKEKIEDLVVIDNMFEDIYDEVVINLFDKTFYVSLKAGLWEKS